MKTWKAVVGIGLIIAGVSWCAYDYTQSKLPDCTEIVPHMESTWKDRGVDVDLWLVRTLDEKEGIKYCTAVDKNDGDVVNYFITTSDNGEFMYHAAWE